MRIAIAIVLFVVSLATNANAQNILSLPGAPADSAHTKNTFIIIKGEEIRRFPSPNFMDAVNGLFPWVFSPSLNQNDYLFVINGFVYPDINSISLNDIEEVIFTRDDLYGSLFHFSRAGTFVITTKTPKDGRVKINFNSQYNVNWNNAKSIFATAPGTPNSTVPATNDLGNKTGHYIDEHVSLSWAGKRLSVYFSAGINDEQLPQIHQNATFGNVPYGDTVHNAVLKTGYNSQRLSLNLGYRFSKKIEAGLIADYSHHRFTNELGYDRTFGSYSGSTHSASQAPISYYHLAAFINYKIIKNLSNTLWAEYLFEKPVSDYNTARNDSFYTNPPIQYITTGNTKALNKKYIIRDQLQYKLFPHSKFTSAVSLTFAYLRRNASTESFSQSYQNGMLQWTSTSKLWFKEKFASLNPMFNFSYGQFISGYAGMAFLIGKKTFKSVQAKDKKGIYTGLELSLAPLLKANKYFTSLSLSPSYSDLPRNTAADYWLNLPYLSGDLGLDGTLFAYPANYNPYEAGLGKNKLVVITLNAGFLQNRFHFIAEWSQLKSDDMYAVTVSSFPPYTVYLRGVETTKGLSLAVLAKLIDKGKTAWQSRFNLLFPKTTLDQVATAAAATPYRSSMRAGWQNQVQFNHFFIQLNATLDLGHVNYLNNYYPQQTEKHNEASLNYVLLGYKVPMSTSSKLKELSVFIQARNLIASKRLVELYEYDHYAGIGVNLSF